MVVLRILGRYRADEPFTAIWQRFAPWMWWALAVMAATGLVLIIGEPLREASALSFWLKMALILVGVLSVLGLRRAAAGFTGTSMPRHATGGHGGAGGLDRHHLPGPLDRL
jgi:hypothetical protein